MGKKEGLKNGIKNFERAMQWAAFTYKREIHAVE